MLVVKCARSIRFFCNKSNLTKNTNNAYNRDRRKVMQTFLESFVALSFLGGIFFLMWFFGRVSDGHYRKQIEDFFTEYYKQRELKAEENFKKMVQEIRARSKT